MYTSLCPNRYSGVVHIGTEKIKILFMYFLKLDGVKTFLSYRCCIESCILFISYKYMLDLIVFVQEAEKEKCPNEHQFPLLTIHVSLNIFI